MIQICVLQLVVCQVNLETKKSFQSGLLVPSYEVAKVESENKNFAQIGLASHLW